MTLIVKTMTRAYVTLELQVDRNADEKSLKSAYRYVFQSQKKTFTCLTNLYTFFTQISICMCVIYETNDVALTQKTVVKTASGQRWR